MNSIALNDVDIAVNVAEILNNSLIVSAAIKTNAESIASNEVDIAANIADIATNSVDIAENANDIAENDEGIAANVADRTDRTLRVPDCAGPAFHPACDHTTSQASSNCAVCGVLFFLH